MKRWSRRATGKSRANEQYTADSEAPVKTKKRSLILLHTIWWLLVLMIVATFFAAVIPRFDELQQTCLSGHQLRDCGSFVLTPGQSARLVDSGVTLRFWASYLVIGEVLIALVYLALAIFIVLKLPENPVALLMSLGLVVAGLIVLPELPSALDRAYPAMTTPIAFLTIVVVPAFFYLVFTFPNGRFQPGWMLWATLGMIGINTLQMLLRLFFPELSQRLFVPILSFATIILLIFAIAGQVQRYRHILTQTERQQFKWILSGLIGVMATGIAWLFLFDTVLTPTSTTQLWLYLVFFTVWLPLSILLPITVTFSIVKYRLYDIDSILNRALVYGLLSSLLLLGFTGSVILFQFLLDPLTGGNDLAVAGSTLLVAALFRPLRNRLQRFVDRRFYRRKYNAQQTLRTFSLTARDAVNLDQLAAELTSVVVETVQPEHVSIWLPGGQPGESRS